MRTKRASPLRQGGSNPDRTQHSNAPTLPARNASRSDAGGHHSAQPESRTACPTKPKLYVADRSSRPRKRGTLHNRHTGEVGRTTTSTRTKPLARISSDILIGIDWGGTKIEGMALTQEGKELLRVREDTPRHDYEGCLRIIVNLVERLENEIGCRGKVGIGIPGSLEPKSRLGKGASSTWLLGKPVERDLRTALDREIRVENDADCLAASEAVDGAGAGYQVVFAVILGSGAGAGIAINGRAHHGPNNSGGEWGHNPLPYPNTSEIPGSPCYCGKHGCMETWVSGRAFQADYARHCAIELAAKEIIARMRAGEHLARLIWHRYLDRVARGLSIVVNTLDPDIFVMGGGMSNVDELYTELPAQLARYTFSTVFETPIRKAIHGDSSGVRGAAWLWKESRRV